MRPGDRWLLSCAKSDPSQGADLSRFHVLDVTVLPWPAPLATGQKYLGHIAVADKENRLSLTKLFERLDDPPNAEKHLTDRFDSPTGGFRIDSVLLPDLFVVGRTHPIELAKESFPEPGFEHEISHTTENRPGDLSRFPCAKKIRGMDQNRGGGKTSDLGSDKLRDTVVDLVSTMNRETEPPGTPIWIADDQPSDVRFTLPVTQNVVLIFQRTSRRNTCIF